MASEHPQTPPPSPGGDSSLTPITELHDPRAIQILSTEHWSVLTARSLAYNEALIRAGMFLTFLSMSFVGLALLGQAMSFDTAFLTVAAIVLAFDLIIGLTTYARIGGANADDLRAMHGMARIRHGYLRAAPLLHPYFTSPVHDDLDSVLAGYGAPPSTTPWGSVAYGFTTSIGMVGLIVSLVAGVLAAVVAMLAGVSPGGSLWIAVTASLIVLLVLIVMTVREIERQQQWLTVRFPAAPLSTEPEQPTV
jgi:hypothetical protein